MFKKIRYAMILTCVMINPLTAMMSSDAVPCPAPTTIVDEGEKLASYAKYLYGDETEMIYFSESILGLYLEVAKSGDQEKIKKAYKELEKEAKQRAIDNVYNF